MANASDDEVNSSSPNSPNNRDSLGPDIWPICNGKGNDSNNIWQLAVDRGPPNTFWIMALALYERHAPPAPDDGRLWKAKPS
eukprot:7981809-Alexandrium_andersonii.AAC.1